MLLLGSITSPKTQVLHSNFLSPHIYRSFFLLSPLTPPPGSLLLPPATALSSSYLASRCSQSISHPLSFTLHSPPPPAAAAATTLASLSSSPLVCFLIFIFLLISCFFSSLALRSSVLIYRWLASCCESVFVTSLLPWLEAQHVQVTCFYSNCN